jgi:hypothetical protein
MTNHEAQMSNQAQNTNGKTNWVWHSSALTLSFACDLDSGIWNLSNWITTLFSGAGNGKRQMIQSVRNLLSG